METRLSSLARRIVALVSIMVALTLPSAGLASTSPTTLPVPTGYAYDVHSPQAVIASLATDSLDPTGGAPPDRPRLAKPLSGAARGFGVAAKAVEDAYDIAAAGGKHAGFLKNYAGRSPQEIDRGIRSIQREIAEHQAAILDPRTKIPNFAGLEPRQQVALVTKKWPSDIARQQEQLAILQRLRSGG